MIVHNYLINLGNHEQSDWMPLEWSFLEDSDAEDAEDTLHSPEPPEPMEPVRHTELAQLPGGYHFLENISCRLPIIQGKFRWYTNYANHVG